MDKIDEKLNELEGYIRQLIAIQVLEYEDQNWLTTDPKVRSEGKEELLNICRLIVNELKEEKDLWGRAVGATRSNLDPEKCYDEVLCSGPCCEKQERSCSKEGCDGSCVKSNCNCS